MNYAHGLVDKNNIIRTVEDIMCTANDSSHQTINDFKNEVNNKLENVYSKIETLDHIDSAITDFQTNVLKKSYITTATIQSRIDSAIEDCKEEMESNIDLAISEFELNELPDQYYNKDEIENEITTALNEYDSNITLNYATKSFVNEVKNNVLNECQQSFFTRDYIKENYYSKEDHNTDVAAMTAKILALEQRIAALEKK